MEIHNATTTSYDEVKHIGVAIKKLPGSNQKHIGIIYKISKTSPAIMLDLQWHHILSQRIPSNNYAWLDCGLDIYNKAALAAYCKDIYSENGENTIPYGVGISGKSFDPTTGKWILSNPYDGLTCASFVLEVFAAQGHTILNKDSWQERESDKDWQNHIIDMLEDTAASPEHIKYQRNLIGAFRYRPEEVAGAIPQDEYPVDFNDALEYAKEVLAAI